MSRRDGWISESNAVHTSRGYILTIEGSVIVITTLIALLFGGFGPTMIFIEMMSVMSWVF